MKRFTRQHLGERPSVQPREVKTPHRSRRFEPALHVRQYLQADWHSAPGVARKRRKIEARGLPNFHKWRFVTLTCAHKQFEDGSLAIQKSDFLHDGLIPTDPCQMYLRGKSRLQYFIQSLRRAGILEEDCPWAWKLEFQADGFPHWHLLLGRKSKFSGREMTAISKAWGLGRVNCEMIHSKGNAFHYTFKYAFKAVMQAQDESEIYDPDETQNCIALPDWFLDFVGTRRVSVKGPDGDMAHVNKPCTMKRARFWQTSKGFYTRPELRKPRDKKDQKTWSVPFTVRQSISLSMRAVRVIARNHFGRYQASAVVLVKDTLEKFWSRIGWDSIQGGSVGLACWSFIVPTILLKHITSCQNILSGLCAVNSMNLRLAVLLSARGQTLQTC